MPIQDDFEDRLRALNAAIEEQGFVYKQGVLTLVGSEKPKNFDPVKLKSLCKERDALLKGLDAWDVIPVATSSKRAPNLDGYDNRSMKWDKYRHTSHADRAQAGKNMSGHGGARGGWLG